MKLQFEFISELYNNFKLIIMITLILQVYLVNYILHHIIVAENTNKVCTFKHG
ncbi:hypothetical protein SAMN06295960_4732 [Paenibacillus aquistagni]|uniref:Uncharacterized protein n=1 Tax=Paenibacillus aquistagni TaxID=1852522 RepID=A0A1X7LZQ9_9BACL|nr:hypothetical protein SAMN06295960_4732 [Paenibacillus aquistagni]